LSQSEGRGRSCEVVFINCMTLRNAHNIHHAILDHLNTDKLSSSSSVKHAAAADVERYVTTATSMMLAARSRLGRSVLFSSQGPFTEVFTQIFSCCLSVRSSQNHNKTVSRIVDFRSEPRLFIQCIHKHSIHKYYYYYTSNSSQQAVAILVVSTFVTTLHSIFFVRPPPPKNNKYMSWMWWYLQCSDAVGWVAGRAYSL